MRERNQTIDLFRYVAALMVIAIHTTRTFGTDSSFGFFVINIICRIAVPYFAICSGYYLSTKWKGGGAKNNGDFKAVVIKHFKKIFIMYAVWSSVYLIYSIPSWLSTGWFSRHAFIDFAIGAIKNGSHYHLWYLLSLLYALPVFEICLILLRTEWLLPLSVFLWVVKVISYGYIWLLPERMKNILLLMDAFPAFRDALFCILPLLLLGTYIRIENEKNTVFKVVGFAISFFALCIEAFFLKGKGQTAVSYIFFTYPTAYFFMQVVLVIRNTSLKKIAWILGKVSLIVYCVHPMIGELIDKAFSNNVAHYIVTVILATEIGLVWVFVKEKVGGKKYV